MPFSSRCTGLIGTTALLVSLIGGCAAIGAKNPVLKATTEIPHSVWYSDVRAMADASDNAGRRTYLRQRLLSNAGMGVVEHPFDSGGLRGENLIATIDSATKVSAPPLLLIGAHFDRVGVGRGATDNASGSAAVLALAERFHRQPLERHRLHFAFWDLEERGLLGATAYVEHIQEQNSEQPALYINFDVFGWGDSLWMMSHEAEHPLVVASREAAKNQGLAISVGEQYPPTDHLAFLKAGYPAVSYSLVGADEIPDILSMFKDNKPKQIPKVMAVIHSDNDTIDQVDDVAMAKGIDAVEAAIRAWDAQSK